MRVINSVLIQMDRPTYEQKSGKEPRLTVC